MNKNLDAITVLVVDDHPVVREGIAAMVDQQPDLCVIGEAANSKDAISLWREHAPQVILLDLEMGGPGGMAVLQSVRSANSRTQVIVLTTYDLEEDIYRAVQGGAAGYLLKDIPRKQLLDAIRRVAKGEKVLPPAIAAKLAQRVGSETLTPREIDVLRLVAQGLANKEIGDRLGVAEATVKTHVNGLMQKLRAASRTEAAAIAQSKGWIRK